MKPTPRTRRVGEQIRRDLAELIRDELRDPRLALLSNRDFYSPIGSAFDSSDPLTTAYVSGETGIAYEMEPGQCYQIAAAAATYTNGQEVTAAASGRVAAAASGNIVIGHVDLGAGVSSRVVAAGELIDVVVANRYTKA